MPDLTNVTLAAALIAAAVSVVNVIATSLLARDRDHRSWRSEKRGEVATELLNSAHALVQEVADGKTAAALRAVHFAGLEEAREAMREQLAEVSRTMELSAALAPAATRYEAVRFAEVSPALATMAAPVRGTSSAQREEALTLLAKLNARLALTARLDLKIARSHH